jgi:hypothetical protein
MGYLVSREITDEVQYYVDEKGERQQRVIPANVLAVVLSADGWKPVKDIDESRMVCDDENYYIMRI